MTIEDIKSSTEIPRDSQLDFQDFEMSDKSKMPINTGSDTSGFGLSGSKSSWLNLNHYSKYFNVTTEDVQERLRSSLMMDGTFLERLNGRLDFYGPLWISISVALFLFVASSFTKRVWAHPGETLDLTLLTFGVMEMLVYTSLMSAISWGFFKWRGVDGVKLGETVALTGYSLTVLIPALVSN